MVSNKVYVCVESSNPVARVALALLCSLALCCMAIKFEEDDASWYRVVTTLAHGVNDGLQKQGGRGHIQISSRLMFNYEGLARYKVNSSWHD